MKFRGGIFRFLNRRWESLSFLSADNRLLIKRVILIGWIVILLILVCSFLVWRFEHNGLQSSAVKTFWDGIWWAIVTIATVGYGDEVPITVPGRAVGIILITFGVVLMSAFTGLIASVFVEDKLKGAKGLKPIHASHHLVLCGWNQTALILLQALTEKNLGDIIIGVVSNQSVEAFESIESRFPNLQLKFVRGEPTQEEVLRRASIQSADQVIILADESLSTQSADDRSIIIANAVRFISRKVNITVQLMNSSNKNLLNRIGIESIIVNDELGGYLLANTLLERRYLELYQHLAKKNDQLMSIVKIPEHMIGKTYGDLFDYYYREEKSVLMGVFTKEVELNLDDIFNDDASAIDQFIKVSLSKSKKVQSDKRTNINWNPKRDLLIEANFLAIVMA